MRISVAICTWNRAGLLDQTLAEMCKLRIPAGVDWELLVVNNNSTDHTDEVIARHSKLLPLRGLFERKQGISHAKNCAVDAVEGDLLLWTDDDVLVDEYWLAEYVRAANDWPEASFFGGRIDPWYETEPPGWFRKHESALLPLRSLADEERLLNRNELIFGASMAFRIPVMKRYPFDPELGRVGDTFVLGEEDAVMNRMRDDGHVGVWVPSAVIKHLVPRSRMERKNVWKYVHGLGRMTVRMRENRSPGPTLFGAPRWLYPQYAKALATYAWQRATLRDDPFPALRKAALLEGWIAEFRHQSRLAQTNGGATPPLAERATADR